MEQFVGCFYFCVIRFDIQTVEVKFEITESIGKHMSGCRFDNDDTKKMFHDEDGRCSSVLPVSVSNVSHFHSPHNLLKKAETQKTIFSN